METPTAALNPDVETPQPMAVVDSNDYSRFKDLPDSDDEVSAAPQKVEEKLTLVEALSRANGFKDAGNSAFKRNDYDAAGKRYTDGIAVLDNFQKNLVNGNDDDVKSLFTSLHSNNAMVLMKLENWNSAIISASAVLKIEKNNIKALFRRGFSYRKVGFLEESKIDLTHLLELEGSNAPAVKELAQVLKDIKESKQKEKIAFSNMFKKNIYGDKEAERIKKEKREEIEREKENDEWIKSKLSRRSLGKEELTLDEWKKEKKEIAEKQEKDRKESQEKADRERNLKIEEERREKLILDKIDSNKDNGEKNADDDDEDYDEEDNKILTETKKKGYCYFRNEQSSEVKALIGDITPKALQVQGLCSSEPHPIEEEAEKMKGSSWNHAGTWEEKDMTEFSKTRLTALCLEASATGADLGSRVRASVTAAKTVQGEAQIVMARGKKKFIYDFNITLDIEVVVDAESGPESTPPEDAPKARRFKGALTLPEVTPNTDVESSISFKKAIPLSLDKIITEVSLSLRNMLSEKMKIFETEFKSL